jgi:hypothetical protein
MGRKEKLSTTQNTEVDGFPIPAPRSPSYTAMTSNCS